MAGQDHLIEHFGTTCGFQGDAMSLSSQAQYRRVQAFVFDRGQDLVDVLTRATLDGEPLRPVGDLQQAVVVAEANHGRHGELQHLLCRA